MIDLQVPVSPIEQAELVEAVSIIGQPHSDRLRRLLFQHDQARVAGERLAAILKKYQARYHGAAHAQKAWDEGDAALTQWKALDAYTV